MGNQEQYAKRMEKNIDDKLVLFDFMGQKMQENLTILDFGCGSGGIFAYLNSLYPNSTLVGFDKSKFMIERAKEKHPNGIFLLNFEELESFIKENKLFDCIILNSVLHEIYSYENRFDSVIELLKKLSQYLETNGKFLIRDGILDTKSVDNSDELETYELNNPKEGKIFLEEYRKLSPFPNNLSIQDGQITGPWHEVREFLNKYTWGFESLYRESQEIVNFASIDMYHEIFNKAGLKIEKELLLSQEDYFSHLKKIIKIGNKRWKTKIVFSAFKNN